MIVAVDIDGVLSDYSGFIYKFGLKYKRKHPGIKMELKNKDGYLLQDIFEVEPETIADFWRENIPAYIRYAKPTKGSVKCLNKLAEEGHKIFILTAREYDCGFGVWDNELQEMTMDWLDYYKIPYDKFFCNESNKRPVCEEYKVDFLIDDSPKNAIAVEPITKCILFTQPYNKSYEAKYRANGWKEVYEIIRKESKKEKVD